MLVVNTCCGCIGLRTGCLIIGYVNLVFNLIVTIISIMTLSGTILLLGYVDRSTEDGAATAAALTAAVAITALLTVIVIVFLVFNVLFIVGVNKERPGFVKAYLIYTVVFLVLFIIEYIASLATGSVGAWNIIQGIIEILLSAYFIIVVRSHYLNMVASNVNGA